VRGFKSLADCEVTFSTPLTVLIGRNAAGKSNVLDALAFVQECLAIHPAEAVRNRGGFGQILTRVAHEQADRVFIELELNLAADLWDDAIGASKGPGEAAPGSSRYGFELSPGKARREPVRVLAEWATVYSRDGREIYAFRRDSSGRVVENLTPESYRSLASNGALFGATDPWMVGTSYLWDLQVLAPDPETMRKPFHSPAALPGSGEPQDSGGTLDTDGANLGAVISAVAGESKAAKTRLDQYLSAIVPGAEGIDEKPLGESYSTFHVRMRDESGNTASEYEAAQLSDGTVRAAAVLAGLFQQSRLRIPTEFDVLQAPVCIDEPELGLHPAAAGAMFDALTEASARMQVIVATQSGDLLDRDEIDPNSVRVVAVRDGVTVIGPIDETSRSILGKGLGTVGELMRGDQLEPGELE
jgi:predicted ATPase